MKDEKKTTYVKNDMRNFIRKQLSKTIDTDLA